MASTVLWLEPVLETTEPLSLPASDPNATAATAFAAGEAALSSSPGSTTTLGLRLRAPDRTAALSMAAEGTGSGRGRTPPRIASSVVNSGG